MAKLRIYQTIEQGAFVMLFTSEAQEVSISDKQLMDMFGEPELDFGGDFRGLNEDGTEVTDTQVTPEFSLPNNYAKILSGLPYKKVITPGVTPFDEEIPTRLDLYRETMQARFKAAYLTLRSNSTTFTNEFITQI